ncbi:MAG TPA: hypothetical protein VK709_03245 [Candidatus Saccharimonadales bacterium]|jgi:hypothetical protein|nr:hypothetical protein [Candidatus Saccharimonadales bacterium]
MGRNNPLLRIPTPRVISFLATALAIMWVFAGTDEVLRAQSKPTPQAAGAVELKRDKQSSSSSANPLGDHYLMIVNTSIASMMSSQKMAEFDKSAYDGLAVAFWHAYETGPAISSSTMISQIAEWKKSTKKDIWPWVYINRMIGPDESQSYPLIHQPYFNRFKGADLDGQAGAQADFLENWKNSLAAAKKSGGPGVVCDLEFYNYYKEYDPGELARQTGKTPEQVATLLRGVGAKMADIAATEYPRAVLWFLFTGFTHPGYKTYNGQPYYPSPTYIAMGLLDEIRERHLELKVVAGGEGSLAYCHHTLQDFQTAIQKRGLDFASPLQKYQGNLELGGTIAMWSDRSAKTGWALEGECATATASTAEDFQPYLELLFRSYRYNWIWVSSDSGYNAFEPTSAQRFNAVIGKAKTTSPKIQVQ